jgi:hypothetical protein
MGRGSGVNNSSAQTHPLLRRSRGAGTQHPYTRPYVALSFGGPDGNPMVLMAQVARTLRAEPGAGPEAADRFLADAMKGDYYNVLRTIDRYAQPVVRDGYTTIPAPDFLKFDENEETATPDGALPPVELDIEGNTFIAATQVRGALERRYSVQVAARFFAQATAGDHHDLLRAIFRWCVPVRRAGITRVRAVDQPLTCPVWTFG